MSHKDHVPDQITCKSIKLAGPIQGKKIEIQVDVKPIQEEPKPNYNWQILGFLFLILFSLIVIVGSSGEVDSFSNPCLSDPSHRNSQNPRC
ncbi:hypothetical protein [Planktothrix agardhii]|jgi:hypothetical protein|uniref:Uncharacterized protein n=2 Tax=Planktothrix agardhii TaxID=1160 RepID=A0A073CY65_PLAA1|nr:hypothetical protein [Planktothrix agardhii]MCF3605431.1 hypothetical protein [Planktothrix agardhii 1033]CAH2571988.1 hypothetical protein PRNO82_01387 [Planktothrix rubescens]BBD53857.1 hypothetical protein NIES204_11410 [Planktothrix agardhii NIES-204]KEI68980.1 hypothetical protein A19Y_4302 [Planktothrix agardhii NIVA-CYA 126/8]MBG0745424.1 hypothetical protein [Planktothrix agardhii KL2]